MSKRKVFFHGSLYDPEELVSQSFFATLAFVPVVDLDGKTRSYLVELNGMPVGMAETHMDRAIWREEFYHAQKEAQAIINGLVTEDIEIREEEY